MSASIHKIESLSMTNSARRSSRWPRTFRSYGANHLQPIANANAWCGCCWKISPWSVGTTLLTVEEMAKVLDIHPRVKIWNRHGPIRGHAYNGKNDSLCEGPGTSRATHTDTAIGVMHQAASRRATPQSDVDRGDRHIVFQRSIQSPADYPTRVGVQDHRCVGSA